LKVKPRRRRRSNDEFRSSIQETGKTNEKGKKMARREIITINEVKVRGFNVNAPVGDGGENEAGDVLLVQAMFQYLAELVELERLGLKSSDEIPAPTGRIDDRTLNAIKRYQQSAAVWSLLSADGLIHPADSQSRNIRLQGLIRLKTITSLQLQIYLEKPFYLDYTEEILRRVPQLETCLDQ
jgi:hypothetical protein